MSEFVKLSVEDGISTIRLDRPPMNALNIDIQEGLRAAAATFTADADVRAIIVHGGEKVFAAGADIKEMAGMTYVDMAARAGRLTSAFDAIARIPKPVVAAPPAPQSRIDAARVLNAISEKNVGPMVDWTDDRIAALSDQDLKNLLVNAERKSATEIILQCQAELEKRNAAKPRKAAKPRTEVKEFEHEVSAQLAAVGKPIALPHAAE